VKSHALRRKERKRALNQAGDSDIAKVANEKSTKAVTTTSSVRQNSVWVGNLAFKTTPESLKKFFDGVGEITRVHMPTKNMGQGGNKFNVRGDNMGFAYVDFTTSDAKTIAISLSENNLDGRKLLIKDGSDFSGRPTAPESASIQSKPSSDSKSEATPVATQSGTSKFAQKVLKKQGQPPGPTLFMGNLAFEVSIQDIRKMLEAHRNVKNRQREGCVYEEQPNDKWLRKIRLGTFEDSGKCKGWAFLDFVDVAEATAALTTPRNHRMNGRDLKLEYASPDAVRRGGHLNGKDGEGPRKKAKNIITKPATSLRDQTENKEFKNDQQRSTTANLKRNYRERIGKDGKARPRPGAALALAKRENVAIVESEGKKIKF